MSPQKAQDVWLESAMSAPVTMRSRHLIILGLALLWFSFPALGQTSTSTVWHLPLDPQAHQVFDGCHTAGVLVPSVQPMTTWNRPDSLKPTEQGFDGLSVLGEARQMLGDFTATGTAIGLGGSGTFGLRGSYHIAATRWRMPLGFPLAREVADHASMDGLGRAVLLNESVASIDRIEGALSWALSPSVAFRVGQESHHWGRGARSLFLDRHMAPAAGARLWVDAGIVQYAQVLLRTRHVVADTVETGWLAAQWAEVSLGGGWSGALFGAVKWRANDVAFDHRVEPHYLVPMAAFRPREYNLGSSDNALLGAQLSHVHVSKRGQQITAYGQLLLDELLVSKLLEGNQWWGNKWGVLAGTHWMNQEGTMGWLLEGSAVRPWTYTHNTLPLSYSHLHQPLGHPGGANFVEGRARFRVMIGDELTLRVGYLRRIQGRSIGGGEGLLGFAAGEMPWTSFSERDGEDGHLWLQGSTSKVSRLELDFSKPLGSRIGVSGIEAFVRTWLRLEEQSNPGAWEEPWNAGRLEVGIRQTRVMDERDW